MYSPAIFDYIPRGKVKWVLQTDVFQKLIREGAISGCIVPGFYMNINDSQDLSSVKAFLKDK
jgi:NDP-sugar pyrophosphorylase family protein